MPGRIDSVEIFAVGRWKGSKTTDITSDDLDAMVTSFNELNTVIEGFKPPLKLGHAEQQKFWGGKSGMPALGFVEKIWREGDKILANFIDMPEALIDMVKRRLYNTVSIEFYTTIEHAGRKFKNVLAAVAILGAELPAVKGLKELSASLFADVAPELKLEFSEKVNMYTQEQLDAQLAADRLKAKVEFEAAHAAAIKALNDSVAELKTKFEEATKGKVTAEAALATFKADGEQKEIAALVDTAIKEGRILPKQKDEIVAMASALTGKIKFGNEEKSGVDVVKSFLAGLPTKVDYTERGTAKGDKEKLASEQLAVKVAAKIAADPKMTQDTAVRLALAEDPELKQAYFAEV